MRNPGQASFEEYKCLRETICRRAPCNLLVFGLGRDSRLWVDSNCGGRTVFLEHVPAWIEQTQSDVADAEIYTVEYDTRRFQWRWLLNKPKRLFMASIPNGLIATDWDIIFVDAPAGTRWKSPGRMKSIYTAAVLARESGDTDVFVHDCDRKVERAYSDNYLGDADLLEVVDTLRHYYVGRAPTADETG
ncbi:MAG: hypothetical protein JSV86_12935 [Gemmatimonadota bacterium]|nr:MAG: hypothetical protein JSV86_12935 [Gemmatimonadota bacterium]